MAMPGRTHETIVGGYRYGFNGKESTSDDGFDAYDFGGRSYDERLGRWMSIDAHAKTYPGLSPYQYAFNSPNLFNDPDGKDGRITIIPNSDGTGGKIIIETVVYLFGPNAKEKLSKTLEEDYANLLGTVGEFTDASGKEWSIEINVTYSDKYVDVLNDYFSEILDDKGDVSDSHCPVPPVVSDDLRKQLKDFKDGDNLLFVSVNTTHNTSMSDYLSKSDRTSGTIFHETFHLLDFIHTDALSQGSDIYSDKIDIMEGGLSAQDRGSQEFKMIHPVHYFDVVKTINRVYKGEKATGTKVFKPKGRKAENSTQGTNKGSDLKRTEGRKHKLGKKKGGSGNGKKRYDFPKSKKNKTPPKPTKTKK